MAAPTQTLHIELLLSGPYASRFQWADTGQEPRPEQAAWRYHTDEAYHAHVGRAIPARVADFGKNA